LWRRLMYTQPLAVVSRSELGHWLVHGSAVPSEPTKSRGSLDPRPRPPVRACVRARAVRPAPYCLPPTALPPSSARSARPARGAHKTNQRQGAPPQQAPSSIRRTAVLQAFFTAVNRGDGLE
jgi:hypothetical protein